MARQDPNLRVSKVYFPEDLPILVHQLRVCPSPDQLPPGFFWYGARRSNPGRVPNWLQRMLAETDAQDGSASTMTPEAEEAEEDREVRTDSEESETLVPEWLEHVDQESNEPDTISESGPGRYSLRDRRQTRKPVRLMQNCTTEQFGTN